MFGGIFNGINLFGNAPKTVPVEEQAQEWQKTIKTAARGIDRDIAKIERDIKKALGECKRLAKAKQIDAAKLLARQVVQTRKEISRLHTSKATLNSVSASLKNSMGMYKVSGLISTSTEVMHGMNQLITVPECQSIALDLSRELERAGLMERVMDDAMAATEPEELEGQADEEINKLMAEILAGTFTPGTTVSNSTPVSAGGAVQKNEESAMSEEQLAAMQARLAGL